MQVLWREDTDGGVCGSSAALVDAGAQGMGPRRLDLPATGCEARLTCSGYRVPTELVSPYTSAKVVDGQTDTR